MTATFAMSGLSVSPTAPLRRWLTFNLVGN